MRFYNSLGPNPRALRMFLHEKGLTIEPISIDVMGNENRRPPYTDKNPGGQVPALELDDGRLIGETVAIFEYLEEKYPNPPLIGANAEQRAETRQWQRLVELKITENAYNAFRFGTWKDFFAKRMPIIPEAADGLKGVVRTNYAWLERQMAGKTWIVGDRFTIADIILYVEADFGAQFELGVDPSLPNLTAWKKRVDARPSAAASLHPDSAKAGVPG
ncbi:MAG: glutathione S-transferase family protein [Candidatus Binatia bacterium]